MGGNAIEKEAQRQLALLKGRCVDVLVEEELRGKLCRSLRTQTPLRVKLGLDPTAPDLHIGHTVVIHKLREFQSLGHEVIFLIGDFTGMIGDPTGRSETRKALTETQIAQNAETYKRQIFKILDPAKTVIDYNSRRGKALGSEGIIKLAAQYTVKAFYDLKVMLKDPAIDVVNVALPNHLHRDAVLASAQEYESIAAAQRVRD